MSFLSVVVAVWVKDLRLERRGRHALNVLLPFAVATLLVYGLSLGPGRTILEPAAPALLWVTILFTAILSVRRSFDMEEEDGALDGLVLAPADKGAIYVGKVLGVVVALLPLEVAIAALAVFFFGLPIGGNAATLMGSLVLGTLGLAAIGSLFAGLVVRARAREALLPLLVLPLVVPVALGSIRSTALGLGGQAADASSWLLLLTAFDAVFVGSGVLLFEKVIED